MVYDLVGLLIFVLDIYALYMILSGGGSPGNKLLWVVVVLLLPLIGMILYFMIGRESTA